MRTLATYNIKGGVGKTATAVNLAYLAAREGLRTLLWDLDPQGAASYYLRVEPELDGGMKRLLRKRSPTSAIRSTDFEGLDVLPADFSARNLDLFLDRTDKPKRQLELLMQPIENSYDVVFLDCAPGISLVSEAVFRGAHALLVPTIPTPLSVRTLHQIENHLSGMRRRKRPALLPFASLVDVRKRLHRDFRDRLAQDETCLRTWIPYASIVEQMGVRRSPLPAFARSSLPACAYEQLWEEIENRIGLASGLPVHELTGGL